MSPLMASTTTPPVSSHCRRPASTTHHSSNSRCQCGRLPPPGGEAIRVTRLRSSAMRRRAHGPGPMRATTSATRVRSGGPSAAGAVGPAARRLMSTVTGDATLDMGRALPAASIRAALLGASGCGGPSRSHRIGALRGGRAMSVTTRALHPLFGVEAVGVDVTRLDEAAFAEVVALFEEHSVLLFRGQTLTDEAQIAFSRRFGPLETTIRSIASQAATPIHVANLSNVDAEGRLIPTGDKRSLYNAGNQMWHTDSSFKKVPAHASLLSAREVPPEGGETQFASMRVAYARLPEDTRAFLEDKVAVHSFVYSRGLVDDAL